jgi:hypothetical protein
VKHFKDIQYTPLLTYGEMLLQNEYEMSCYNLDAAHVASQQQLFELHQQARPYPCCCCFCCSSMRNSVHQFHLSAGTLIVAR